MGSRLRLDASLWDRLGSAEDRGGFARAWLTLQCSELSGVRVGVVAMRPHAGAEGLRRLASWPEEASADAALQDLAERCVDDRCGQARITDGRLDVAFPLIRASSVEGVIALGLDDPEGDPDEVLRSLQWGSGWLLARLAAEESDRSSVEGGAGRELVAAVDEVVAAGSYEDACRTAATRLASRTGSDRVSVALRKGGDARLVAVSHMAVSPGSMNLIRAIETLVDEACDQDAVLAVPGPGEVPPRLTLEHERHRREQGVEAILTVPYRDPEGDVAGSFCLERAKGPPFEASDREVVAAVAGVLGPVLELRRREERWIGTKLADAGRRQLARLFGPAFLGRKLFALGVVLALAFAWFATGTFRVTADSRLEASLIRTIAAPADGFIAAAPVRAGDRVAEGDLIYQLDDRDLMLERIALVSQRAQLAVQLQDARARGERAESGVFSAQAEQVEAQLALVEEQIRRMRVEAPFDGLVISGDLSQALGSSVSRGDELFQLAPRGGYRVILQVPEADVDHVTPEQAGTLLLTPLPDRRFGLRVTRITPVTSVADGVNRFRVEAELLDEDPRLRPGMEGVAKVEVGERRLVWIWTRRFTEWLELTLWRFSP